MISRVLVAPLNWGLGHATRCIPIIDELLANGFEVSLASDGLALELLKDAYPQLRHYTLPAYAIRYGSANMLWNMAWQWPKILRAIYREHQYLKHLVQQTPFDLIISDNRYGCYHAEIKSVILTHQLRIQLPYPALEQIIAKINKTLIDRFDECWIPDFEVSPGLAGQLSHANRPSRYRYIGPLSRMQSYRQAERYEAIVVLSGPEPQRTYLEKRLLDQARSSSRRYLFVQGLADRKNHYIDQANVEVVSFLNTADLNRAILSAEVVVCRSGYSSIMDLCRLGKKALLIPTPGQTEQVYLAEMLSAAGYFYIMDQDQLDLDTGIDQALARTGAPDYENSLSWLSDYLVTEKNG